MTQLRYLGAITAMAACLAADARPASAGPAGQERTVRRGDVTFTSALHGGEAVLAVEAPGVRIEKRAGTNGSGTIVLTTGDDRVSVTLSGRELRVARAGTERVIPARAAKPADVAAVRALLQKAPAVEASARLRRILGDDAPTPVLSALAFVSMLAGDTTGMRRVADQIAPGTAGIQFARYTADGCWREYELSISIFFDEYQQCLEDHRWNYILFQACNFTYVVQAEIAWFTLLSCAGGLPAV